MSNLMLMKRDGNALRVPPSSIICLLSTARDPKKDDNENVNCALMSDFRGLSTFLLQNTAQEVFELFEQNKKKSVFKNRADSWLVLSVGHDFTYLKSGTVAVFEQMTFKGASGEPDERIRVHFRLPNGEFMHVDVDNTEENLQILNKDADRNDQ